VKETGKGKPTKPKAVPDKSKALIVSWDTCVFLAWIKNEARPNNEMAGIQAIAKQIEANKVTLITSALTKAEIYQSRLTKAQRDKYQKFLRRSNVYVLPLDDKLGDLVSEIRDHYESTDFELLTPDAIHLATAIHYEADHFQTFDGANPSRKPREKTKKRCGLLLLDGTKIAGKYEMKICKPDALQMDMLAQLTESLSFEPQPVKQITNGGQKENQSSPDTVPGSASGSPPSETGTKAAEAKAGKSGEAKSEASPQS